MDDVGCVGCEEFGDYYRGGCYGYDDGGRIFERGGGSDVGEIGIVVRGGVKVEGSIRRGVLDRLMDEVVDIFIILN